MQTIGYVQKPPQKTEIIESREKIQSIFLSQLQLVAGLNVLNHMDHFLYPAVLLFPCQVWM